MILTAVTGMLARILPRRVDGDPVALVPVSVRREGEQGGNRISTVLVDLPIGARRPVRPARRGARDDDRAQGLRRGPCRRACSPARRAGRRRSSRPGLARAMGGVRAFNVVVSNVPGPQQPFWLDGVRLLAAHPVVPLNPANQNLTVGILSYDGRVCFGLLADRDLDPPVDQAAAALDEALAELTG